MPPIVTLQSAREKIAALLTDHAQTVDKYYKGDHWQDGKGWIGPFSEQIRLGNTTATALVQAGFVSRDALKEGIDRHIEGVMGHEPAWYNTVRRAVTEEAPISEEEQGRIQESEAALVEWWDRRKGLSFFQELALSLAAMERAVPRLLVPRGLRLPSAEGAFIVPTPEGGTPAERLSRALDLLFPTLADLESAAVLTDLDTMAEYGVVVTTREGKDVMEVAYLEGGDTVLEVTNDPQPGQVATYRFQWDKRLPIYQATRKILVTPSAVAQQKKLDLSETMEARNIVSAGSPERWLFNADPPGKWEDDPANPGEKKFTPAPFNIGGGVTNTVSGITVEETDAQGNLRKTITTPHLQRLDPAPSTLFESVGERSYGSLLSELKQRHVLMSGDGSASAVSRVQARADYLNSLLLTKTELDAALRWLLETALAMASYFAGLPGRYSDLRIFASCKVDTGPLTPEERRVIIEEYQAGQRSRESTMYLLGVEDVDAEIARIEAEEAKSLAVQQARADVAATLVQKAGTSLKGAMKIAGYEAKEIAAALKADPPKPTPAALVPAVAAQTGQVPPVQSAGEEAQQGGQEEPTNEESQEEE